MPRGECFVVNCLTGRRKHSGHLFCFPKNGGEALRAAWLTSLPARERPFEFDKDVVCHLHFAKEHMDTCWNYMVDDKAVETPRQRWRLMVGAVPTMFPDSQKDLQKSPARKEMEDGEECEAEEPSGGDLSMLPPGYLRMLADACKPRTKRPAEASPSKSSAKSQKQDAEVSMLPPGYLKMLSIVCEEQGQSIVGEVQEQTPSDTKSSPVTSPAVEVGQVFFVLPGSPPVGQMQVESAASSPSRSEAPSRSSTPLSGQGEPVPVIAEVQSRHQESEAEMLTAVESVVTVTTEQPSGFCLVAISNQLNADQLMGDTWTCNTLKDWQSREIVLSCAELVTTHCGAEVQKSITITSQGSSRIYFRHVDVSPEFASFTCFNYSDVKALLRSVKQAKLCTGLSSCDSMDEFCGGMAVNNVWFSESCLQIVAPAERQCRKCKALWSSLEGEPGTGRQRAAARPKPETMTPEQVRDRLRATLRDQTYLKQRLSRVKKTNTLLLREVKELRAVSDARLAEVESGLETAGLPEKQKLAFATAVQAAKRLSRGTPYSAEWLLECNGILRQSNKAYEHLRTRSLLPLPTKKHLRKLLKTIPLASAAAPVPYQNAIQAAGQNAPVTVSALAMAEDGTVTTIVLDEAQVQQLLAENNGARLEEVVILGQNQDHEYSQS